MTTDDIVDIAEFARRLGIGYSRAYRWTQLKEFPPPRIIAGRTRAWSMQTDIIPWYRKWMDEHRDDERVN